VVCCYPDEAGLVEAHEDLIFEAWNAAGAPLNLRLLFSAHGLPKPIDASGDPYRSQVERTCAAVAKRVEWPNLGSRVCYQSRVGPLKWIGPSTVDEIARAGADGIGVMVIPIAFVSEHIETLVELDRDYAEVAERAGVHPYIRVPALGVHPRFIEGLAALARDALASGETTAGATPCGARYRRCALRTLVA